MAVTIPLSDMTAAEKLRALEEIWDDLQRTPQEVPAPVWHADVLHAREERIRRKQSRFNDWDEAKQRIRETFPRRSPAT